jgi:hypothetical protein
MWVTVCGGGAALDEELRPRHSTLHIDQRNYKYHFRHSSPAKAVNIIAIRRFRDAKN